MQALSRYAQHTGTRPATKTLSQALLPLNTEAELRLAVLATAGSYCYGGFKRYAYKHTGARTRERIEPSGRKADHEEEPGPVHSRDSRCTAHASLARMHAARMSHRYAQQALLPWAEPGS